MNLPPDLDPIEQALLDAIASLDRKRLAEREDAAALDQRRGHGVLPAAVAAELFEAQVGSRLVDHTARWLRAEHGRGYYTIGSAGHESNAAVAMALRPTDPALLHYRSGGFYFARASQVPGQDPVGDVLSGMLALTRDQISGGRHKVYGNRELNIIPQTSTIGSHLPRAVGLAVALGWGSSAVTSPWPDDALVVVSLGDASLNHSTTQGALNWAANEAHRGHRVPILFVCEDNGLGISVPTPGGWVAASTIGRPHLEWAQADGADPAGVLEATAELAETIRDQGIPGFLHLRTVRFLGHAGTDVESAYRSPTDRRSDLGRDPILASAAQVVVGGISTGPDLVDWYLVHRAEIRDRALSMLEGPNHRELRSAVEVMEPLERPEPFRVLQRAADLLVAASTLELGTASGDDGEASSYTLAQTLNRSLAAALSSYRETLVFGQDVGRKGGVYGITRGLQSRFGTDRVFDTLLDEQSILGLALGASLDGFLPICEIQYLAYLHNAEDQLRGEAATLAFFSAGQYRNPMVVRVASYAYQRGFGGHFHNDNSVAVVCDIPGIIVASPSHPSDAGPMLASCVAAAAEGAVSVFLEPIALYHTTDLYAEGDGRWTSPIITEPVPIGSGRTHGDGLDGTIITWGNGLHLAVKAHRRLHAEHDQRWRILDLRWLAPLPVDDILREARAGGRVLVVDETRHRGGVGEAVVAAMIEGGFRGPISRVAARDSFIPLGRAADLVLVDHDRIVRTALTLDTR